LWCPADEWPAGCVGAIRTVDIDRIDFPVSLLLPVVPKDQRVMRLAAFGGGDTRNLGPLAAIPMRRGLDEIARHEAGG